MASASGASGLGGLATLDDHKAFWDIVEANRCEKERQRLLPPVVRLWDGDYVLRGQVAGERMLEFEFVENETGVAALQLPLNHYLASWVMDYKGRDKRNVHITIDKQGARWSGRMDNYRVVRDKYGDTYIEVSFKHDFEELKHIYCWANPFLRPEFQFPKLWVIFGPAKWCLLVTLFTALFRLESSLWTLPDDPLDINEWMGGSFWPGNWRNIVKPFPFFGDNSSTTVVFSRFRSFFEVSKQILEDTQLTVTCRRYLKGEDPHPFEGLVGESRWFEDIYKLIPIRHGCLVWDIEDNSEWGSETAFGGSLLTGLVRAVVTMGADGTTEGVDVFTGDPTFPGEYWNPGWTGTKPKAPWVVYEDSPYTGIESSEFEYFEATDTSFLTGGASMPGVNEGISAAINMGGDFLTSYINSLLAPAGPVGGSIDLPPLGGLMDAVAKLAYENVILAFMEIPTLRAMDLPLPLAGLEGKRTSLGDFHYYEGWAEAEKAFTLSAFSAIKAKIWASRAHTTHSVKVSDAAPYYLGEPGFGDFWLGSRVGVTVRGFPTPDTIFVERVKKISYKHDKDKPSGWVLELGHQEPKDPMMKAFSLIQDINGAFSEIGLF